MSNIDMEKIYSQYFKTIYKYLLCLTHNQEIAEDLTQETFYKAIKNINSFKYGYVKLPKIYGLTNLKEKIKY